MIEPDEPDEQCGDRPGEQEPRRAAKIEQSPRRGRRLDTWGWVALLLGAVLFAGNGTLGVQTRWEAGLQLVGLLLMLSGLWAVLRGRRHLQPILGGPALGSGRRTDRAVPPGVFRRCPVRAHTGVLPGSMVGVAAARHAR